MNTANLPLAMVTMAQNRSLPDVLRAIVNGIARCRTVVLARIWLIEPSDQCATCAFREECFDRKRCLHLAASAGNPKDGKANYRRLDGRFRRIPLGVRKIGHAARDGCSIFMPNLRAHEPWVADRAWMERESIKTFAAQPLIFGGEVLGVLAIFDDEVLGDQEFEWLRVFADHAAVSIANARAFEEIEFLRARLEQENDYLRDEVTAALGRNDLMGESPGLRKVIEQIQLVAPTDSAVLVTGESGTGKELVARAIHENSPRRERAFIKVNCGAIPENLFESEFFGHVRGAFTGALKDKLGRFELAHGGTLLLDEIGEVPLPMQTKLLRVLQERELERLGDTRTRRVDVRIVAATNRDLRREVAAGRFRQDLYYRLSVFPIAIPPLRDRREDIPILATHFAKQSARRLQRPRPRMTEATLRQLIQHDWPGNVRELQNAVERAVIVARGEPLSFDLHQDAPLPKNETSDSGPNGSNLMTKHDLKQQERDSILAALRESGGKVFGPGGAAELMGMKPTTLSSRLKALGIQRHRDRHKLEAAS